MIPVISVGLWGCAREENAEIKRNKYSEEAEDLSRYIKTAESVTTPMLKKEFWINMQKNPEDIIMTPEEIKNWCESYKSMNGDNKYGFYGYDEMDEPDIIDGEIVKEIVENSFTVPEVELYNKDGSVILYEFWEEVFNNRNLDDIRSKIKLRYGYTVDRCNIRMAPSAEFVSADKNNDFFCELQVSSILINEPIIIVHESCDGKWYYIFSGFCNGWVESKYIGLCTGRDQWIGYGEMEEFLMVTGDKFSLEKDENGPEISELTLYMGTKLKLVPYENYADDKNGRVPYECYIVEVPIKDEKGRLRYIYGFVPVSRDVNVGYLRFTKENLIAQMFKVNGNRYGWGGMYNARDCSQYIMELYKTFGFSFGRNSATQAKMPFATYDVKETSDEEKKALLDAIPVGSIVYFPGHVMMYLGNVEGEYYVISATGRMMAADEKDENEIYAHTTLVTPLSVRRISGKTWLSSITKIKIIDIK